MHVCACVQVFVCVCVHEEYGAELQERIYNMADILNDSACSQHPVAVPPPLPLSEELALLALGLCVLGQAGVGLLAWPSVI